MTPAEKRQKRLESKLKLQARRSVLLEIDRLDAERCDFCGGPSRPTSISVKCECAAAVKVRELGGLLNQDKDTIYKARKGMLRLEEIKKLSDGEFTVGNYNSLKKLGLSDKKIMTEIGWHVVKMNKWKRENGLIRSSVEKVEVVQSSPVEIKPGDSKVNEIISSEPFTIKDEILQLVEYQIKQQTDKGMGKYSHSLDDCPDEKYDWNLMVNEELIDALQYQQKEIRRLKGLGSLTLKEYQELSTRTMPPETDDKVQRASDISNYSMGLAGEAGEVVDMLKKHIHHGHELDSVEALKELGDVLHYLSGLTSMLGFTLEEVATVNIEKLWKRYPKGFTIEDSVNRSE